MRPLFGGPNTCRPCDPPNYLTHPWLRAKCFQGMKSASNIGAPISISSRYLCNRTAAAAVIRFRLLDGFRQIIKTTHVHFMLLTVENKEHTGRMPVLPRACLFEMSAFRMVRIVRTVRASIVIVQTWTLVRRLLYRRSPS